MKNFFLTKNLLLVGLILSPAVASGAIVFVDGDDIRIDVNDGAWLGGTDTTGQGSFSKELIVQNGGGSSTSPGVQLGEIPFVSEAGTNYFQLIYDAQEVSNNNGSPDRLRSVFTELSVFSSPTSDFNDASLIWSLTGADDVYLNDVNRSGGPFPETNTPLGNGGDMTLNVPFSAFPSGSTTNTFMFFQATQSGADSDNGPDEWVLGSGQFLNPGGTPVPEPSVAILTALGSCLVFFRRRR